MAGPLFLERKKTTSTFLCAATPFEAYACEKKGGSSCKTCVAQDQRTVRIPSDHGDVDGRFLVVVVFVFCWGGFFFGTKRWEGALVT